MTTRADTSPFDLDALRRRFPALAREQAGRPVVYLDGPGGSQVPAEVAAAVAAYLLETNANSDGPYATSAASDAILHDAREAGAELLGVDADEIVFGANTTSINFALAHAAARTLAPGDEIVVTELDHDANVSPWLLVAADHGLVVRTAPLARSDGTLDLDALGNLIGSRTRIVACTLASNALGSVTDIGRVAELCEAAGALLWVDGVHFAPHRRIRRDELRADVVLTSPYKYFGPHLGVAAVRAEYARAWPADRVRPAAETPAGHRFETGTLSHEAIAGFLAAVGYLESLGEGAPSRAERLDLAYARIESHEAELTLRTLRRMAEIPGLSLYGITDPERAAERTPTFCFNLTGWTPAQLSVRLGELGLFTYHGNYYALGAMTALGLEPDGAVRAGYLHYTTPAEADRLCDALAELAAAPPRG